MSKANPTRFMIMDACVLIDYMNGEPDLFKLISSHIGPIYVATPILEEVDSINSIEELEVEQNDPYLLECQYFVDCVQNNKKIERATFEDGKSALELVLAAVSSAKNRKVVNLEAKKDY